jgi:hypothetical protein
MQFFKSFVVEPTGEYCISKCLFLQDLRTAICIFSLPRDMMLAPMQFQSKNIIIRSDQTIVWCTRSFNAVEEPTLNNVFLYISPQKTYVLSIPDSYLFAPELMTHHQLAHRIFKKKRCSFHIKCIFFIYFSIKAINRSSCQKPLQRKLQWIAARMP